MNYSKSEDDSYLMSMMKNYGTQLKMDIAKNVLIQQATLDEFVKGLIECDNKGLKNTKVVWNLSAFVNIISLDLKIITRDLALAEDDWSQRHYIRQAYLLIYEFYKTYHSEQDFYILINEKLDISELNTEKQSVIKQLRDYKKKYEETFRSIRKNTIGHRNHDVMLQIELIENLNYSEAIEIITNFDTILNQLGAFMQKIINLGLDNISRFL